MIQTFKNIPLKFKLITCFLLIISINAISGFMGLNLMKQLGELVNITYDKALMSGTFAQAVKFDFSQFDGEIKSSLLAEEIDDYQKHISKGEKNYRTLIEDLAVVEERALDLKSAELIKDIRVQLAEVELTKNEILALKKQQLSQSFNPHESVKLLSDWDNLKLKKSLYRKLTALYDEAAEVGYHFRLSSEEKIRKISLARSGFSSLASLSVSFFL